MIPIVSIEAETPASVIIQYHNIKFGLGNATQTAQASCMKHGKNARYIRETFQIPSDDPGGWYRAVFDCV